MKVAKRFRWEAAHRLPWHDGACRHLHGHSYRMMVELQGEPDDRGMLIDFKHVKRLVKPLVDRMDHATLIAADDTALKQAVAALDTKTYELPFDSTAENLCSHVAQYLGTRGYDMLTAKGVTTLRVCVWETETCYAEIEKPLAAFAEAAAARGAATTVGQDVA